MKNVIEVGIIGTGNIATTVHMPLLSCMEGVSIKYAADIQEPNFRYPPDIRKIRIRDDLSVLPDCDIVLLAVPVGARRRYIEEFARRNIMIFTEKPFAPDTESHIKFLEVANRINCNYMRTTYSSIRQLKEICGSGMLGELKEVNITEGGIVKKTTKGKEHYQTKAGLSGGGILMESGCHTLSQLSFLFNEGNITVHQAAAVYQNELDVDVSANMIVRQKRNKINIRYQLSFIKPLQTLSTYTFEKAKVQFNHVDAQSQLQIIPQNTGRQRFTLNNDKKWAATFYQAFYLKWKKILNDLKQQNHVNTEEGTSLQTTKIITDIYSITR